MASPATEESPPPAATRKEKRKALKKLRRRQLRQEAAIREREVEEARANDPEEQLRIKLKEQEEAEAAEWERRLFEERELLWLEVAAAKKAEEAAAAAARQAEEEARGDKIQVSDDADDEWEYVEEGPAEIIWEGNEIIVKKNRVRVRKMSGDQNRDKDDDERPTSNPLPPQSAVFSSYKNTQSVSAQDLIENVAQQVPNFGTERDKAHCPFHLKTGACRFGSRCSRAHFYPDKSCTLLIKNMYNGPGLAWEQDEGLEYTDEEVERCYEEFYEDVHIEFLKFGELVNFKITCEFIGVSRWKVAICGEYMKSRLRTCSHGTACNFIHCFSNPRGDYEWTDWDDPPPRYWMKMMAVLFGPSVKAEYDEQMKLEECEKPWEYSRKRTPTNYRHQSRRSTYCEMDIHNIGFKREASDEKRKSHSPRREHLSRRKGTDLLHKHERCEEKHNSEIHGYNAKRRTRDFHEDISKDQDRYAPEKHPEFEEKNALEDHEARKKKLKTEEDLSRQQKREVFHKQHKPKEKRTAKSYRQPDNECRSSDWISDNIDVNEERNNNSSSEDSYGKHGICMKEECDGRYGSDDFDSDKYSHEKTSRQSKYLDEREEVHRYSSQYHRNHVSHDKERKYKRVTKQSSGDEKLFSDESSDDMKTTDRDIDRVETHQHGLKSKRRNQSFKEQNKSDRKRKHRRKKESSEIEELSGNSDSDNVDSNGRAYRKHSRSRTSVCSSASSRRDRNHRRSKES